MTPEFMIVPSDCTLNVFPWYIFIHMKYKIHPNILHQNEKKKKKLMITEMLMPLYNVSGNRQEVKEQRCYHRMNIVLRELIEWIISILRLREWGVGPGGYCLVFFLCLSSSVTFKSPTGCRIMRCLVISGRIQSMWPFNICDKNAFIPSNAFKGTTHIHVVAVLPL